MLQLSMKQVEEFKHAQSIIKGVFHLSRPVSSNSPPKHVVMSTEKFLKVNWDEALEMNTNVTGLCGIVRDHMVAWLSRSVAPPILFNGTSCDRGNNITKNDDDM